MIVCHFGRISIYSQGYTIAGRLGHSIIDPIPSLFTFKVEDKQLADLSGVLVLELFILVFSLLTGSLFCPGYSCLHLSLFLYSSSRLVFPLFWFLFFNEIFHYRCLGWVFNQIWTLLSASFIFFFFFIFSFFFSLQWCLLLVKFLFQFLANCFRVQVTFSKVKAKLKLQNMRRNMPQFVQACIYCGYLCENLGSRKKPCLRTVFEPAGRAYVGDPLGT